MINFRFKREDERMGVCFLKIKIKFSRSVVSSLTRNEMFYIAFVEDMLRRAGGARGASSAHLLYKVLHL